MIIRDGSLALEVKCDKEDEIALRECEYCINNSKGPVNIELIDIYYGVGEAIEFYSFEEIPGELLKDRFDRLIAILKDRVEAKEIRNEKGIVLLALGYYKLEEINHLAKMARQSFEDMNLSIGLYDYDSHSKGNKRIVAFY